MGTTETGWASYQGAPLPGEKICDLADVPPGSTYSVDLAGFPVLLVHTLDVIRAYVNACPHQYLPLDHRGPRVLSADGKVLRCTMHAAGFAVETGTGIEGFGIGECLDVIPIDVIGLEIRIGQSQTN